MALTKKDLTQIGNIVNKIVIDTLDAGLRQYFLPLHDWRIKMDDWTKGVDEKFDIIDQKLDGMDKKFDGLSKRMDKHVFDTEKKVLKNEHLLTGYTYDFVSTKVFKGLEKRVENLELAKV